MAQLFISYRSSDGRDKATALARALGALYGDQQVFLDKDDLRAGVRWRDEIASTLKQQPVLLLLLTPQLLAACDDRGQLRIDDPADPVRREVADALAGGAHIIPLLCDGVTAPPPAADLPPPFNRLGEFTWRRYALTTGSTTSGAWSTTCRRLALPPRNRPRWQRQPLRGEASVKRADAGSSRR
jgi:hypothetical protein